MNSRSYYGNACIGVQELRENHLGNRIELEYYRTKKRRNYFLKENSESYGIEIVKKEYKGKKVNIEKEKIDKVCNARANIDSILNKLKKFKVTPIGLKDVIEDMRQN